MNANIRRARGENPKQAEINASWDKHNLEKDRRSADTYNTYEKNLPLYRFLASGRDNVSSIDGIPAENPNMFDNSSYAAKHGYEGAAMRQLRKNDEVAALAKFANQKISKSVGGYVVNLSFGEDGTPISAEVYDEASGGVNTYYDMSLTYDGTKLEDYDGAYSMPRALCKVLRNLGFESEY